MKTRIPSLFATACLLLVKLASADTILLKDGGKIEGTLIREDADSYVIEVQVSGTIRDEKVVPRGDVVRVDKEKPDMKAFRELESLFPAPELLSKEGYEARIKKLEGFLKEHPVSGKVPKAKEMLEILTDERDIIAEGGIKIGEGMISAEKYEENAYEYDAWIAETRIKKSVAHGDLLVALRKFDEYEQRFVQPAGKNGLAGLMIQVLNAYGASVDECLSTIDTRLAQRKAELETMSAEERARTEGALEEQMAKIRQRFAEEKAAHVKWITADLMHKESLDAAKHQVTTEIARLGTPSEDPAVPLAEVYRTSLESLRELQEGMDKEKKAVIVDAKAKGLPEFYLEKLQAFVAVEENEASVTE